MKPNARYVVTGAAGGMGAVAARLLAAKGARVLCVDRDEAGLARTKADLASSGGEIVTCVADLEKVDDVLRYVDVGVKAWGGLDGAFHIAGWEGHLKKFGDQQMDEFDRCMAANARSVWYGMKAVLPVLLDGGGGSIVNTLCDPRRPLHGGLCRVQACRRRSHQIGRRRIWRPRHPGESRCPVRGHAHGRSMAATINPEDPAAGLRTMTERIPRRKMAAPEEVARRRVAAHRGTGPFVPGERWWRAFGRLSGQGGCREGNERLVRRRTPGRVAATTCRHPAGGLRSGARCP